MTIPVSLASPAPTLQPLLHLVEEMGQRVIDEYSQVLAALTLAERAAELPARATITVALDRLRTYAELHRGLPEALPVRPVNLGDYMAAACRSISRHTEDRGMQIRLMSDDVWVAGDIARQVGLLLAELILCASRNGLSERTGAIALRISADDTGLSCMVVDNGCGGATTELIEGRQRLDTITGEMGGSISWVCTANGNFAHLELPWRSL